MIIIIIIIINQFLSLTSYCQWMVFASMRMICLIKMLNVTFLNKMIHIYKNNKKKNYYLSLSKIKIGIETNDTLESHKCKEC